MKPLPFAARLFAGLLLLCGLGGSAGRCFGDTPIQSPTPSPAATIAPETPLPAAPTSSACKVLVLPFVGADASNQGEGIGKALEGCVATELSRGDVVRPITRDAPTPAAGFDADSALASARSDGAAFVIFGSYQVTGPEVRVRGQVLSVQSGEPAGALEVTGAVHDLFSLEDSLASQVRRRLAVCIPQEPSANPEAGARQVASLEPLRLAPPIRSIAPMPNTELPDPTALLDGSPMDASGYGYGGYGYCGYPCSYGGYGGYGGYFRYGGFGRFTHFGGFFPFFGGSRFGGLHFGGHGGFHGGGHGHGR